MGWKVKTGGTLVAAAMLLTFASSESEARKRPTPTPTPRATPTPTPIPYRPWIPEQPSGTLIIPPKDASGVRQTVNLGASPMQKSWNFRSAYNVAALNCNDPKYAAIVPNYRAFLRTHARGLATVNRAVDAEFRARHGAAFVRHREAYMTKVYNFYALPPTLPAFCNAALAVSEEAKTGARVGALNTFTALALPKLDAVLEDFYNRYDQWIIGGDAWDRQYAALYLQRYGRMYPGSKLPPSAAPAPVPAPAPAPSATPARRP